MATTNCSTDLSAFLDGDSAALPVGHLPALLVRDLPAVGLGYVPAVVDGDGLTVIPRLEALALAVGGQQHVTPVGGLTGLNIILNNGPIRGQYSGQVTSHQPIRASLTNNIRRH